MEKLQFSLKTRSLDVVLEQADGTPKPYVLKEMSASARDKHLDDLKSRIEVVGGDQVINRFDRLQASLLTKCLFEVTETGDKSVNIETIQGWPSTVVSALYKAAQGINDLDKEEQKIRDESKKE